MHNRRPTFHSSARFTDSPGEERPAPDIQIDSDASEVDPEQIAAQSQVCGFDDIIMHVIVKQGAAPSSGGSSKRRKYPRISKDAYRRARALNTLRKQSARMPSTDANQQRSSMFAFPGVHTRTYLFSITTKTQNMYIHSLTSQFINP